MTILSLQQLSSPEARGRRLRFIREHLLNLTREEFCKDNFTPQSLKGWELGWGGGLSLNGAVKVIKRSRELNIYCTDSWLMYGIGREAMRLSNYVHIYENDESQIAKELLVFRELQQSVDTIVSDDAMVPFLYPGTYVGGIVASNIEDAIDKDCIIVTDNDEKLVRILKKGEKAFRYDLIGFNEKPFLVKKELTNIAIKFAAPIIWIRRVFKEDSL